MSSLSNGQYLQLIDSISECLVSGQQSVAQQVNRALVETYWNIGCYIAEFERQGQEKADYGLWFTTPGETIQRFETEPRQGI